jgi:hypothetical protein
MPDDLRARIAEALNTTPAQFIQDAPDGEDWFKDRPYRRHDQHRYDGGCAMCRGETDTLADAVLAVVQSEVDRLRRRAEQAEAAIARARVYCALAADSCRVAARETAQDVIRLLDGDTEPTTLKET